MRAFSDRELIRLAGAVFFYRWDLFLKAEFAKKKRIFLENGTHRRCLVAGDFFYEFQNHGENPLSLTD